MFPFHDIIMTSKQDSSLPIWYSQHHDRWWPGSWWSQAIIRHDIVIGPWNILTWAHLGISLRCTVIHCRHYSLFLIAFPYSINCLFCILQIHTSLNVMDRAIALTICMTNVCYVYESRITSYCIKYLPFHWDPCFCVFTPVKLSCRETPQ